MQTQLSVRRAGEPELDAAARVLALAFQRDPVYQWILREGFAPSLLQGHFLSEARQYLDEGEVYLAGDGSGAALWKPAPGAQPSPLVQLIRALPELRRLTGARRLPRLWALIRKTEARYPRLPYRYLYLIGVQPELQGTGIGSALIRAGLEHSDREGTPTYLESSNERNVPLYERHGFRVVEELSLGRKAPMMWLMWREPRGSG